MENRWSEFVTPTSTELLEAPPALTPPAAATVLRGVAAPQLSMRNAPTEALQLAQFPAAGPGPFWLGAHGGAGETVLASLFGGSVCDHRWPTHADGSSTAPLPVFLVTRTNHHGLLAASLAASDWASGRRPDVTLVGLIAVADAPGKLPKNLARQLRILAGAVPATWVLPWIHELRLTGAVTRGALAHETQKSLLSIEEAARSATEEEENS